MDLSRCGLLTDRVSTARQVKIGFIHLQKVNKLINLHKSTNAEVTWSAEHRVVVKRFTGFIRGQELRGAFNAGHDKMQATGGIKWLSDNRGLPVYADEDIAWINQEWFPKMLKIGWRYWALVEPESTIGKWTMKNFQFFTDQGIKMNVFSSVEEGLIWLEQVDRADIPSPADALGAADRGGSARTGQSPGRR